ncbi:hypothetical protein QFC20_007183 [Naganishia adeliensis]|uniref:Uncharacterized protein n=1 Tax=Naganishia adeliensis TaxID=92952 RepID=A0ACC2V2G4_9TREE|nr:hypothetical protein QFC20_007183 [Naganishia adeliensis]
MPGYNGYAPFNHFDQFGMSQPSSSTNLGLITGPGQADPYASQQQHMTMMTSHQHGPGQQHQGLLVAPAQQFAQQHQQQQREQQQYQQPCPQYQQQRAPAHQQIPAQQQIFHHYQQPSSSTQPRSGSVQPRVQVHGQRHGSALTQSQVQSGFTMIPPVPPQGTMWMGNMGGEIPWNTGQYQTQMGSLQPTSIDPMHQLVQLQMLQAQQQQQILQMLQMQHQPQQQRAAPTRRTRNRGRNHREGEIVLSPTKVSLCDQAHGGDKTRTKSGKEECSKQ